MMKKNRLDIDLSKLIIKTFDKIFSNILNVDYDRVILKGGRNSTKSSLVALALIIAVLVFKCDAVCLVKYDNRIYERLVSTFLEMLQRSGLHGFFKYKVQKKELVLLDSWEGRETQHSIKFTGVDDPQKLKSFKPKSGAGGFRYVWFEEVTDFRSLEEVNNVINTMARGEGEHCIIMTYNPPKSTNNWVNQEYNTPCGVVLGHESNSYVTELESVYTTDSGISIVTKEKQLVHHSTYLDVIESGHPEWLGMTLINAERTRENNYDQYRWEYLGEAIGTEGNVFKNVRDLYNNNFDKSEVFRGLDFGFTTDPSAYVEWCYSIRNRSIYCLNEFVAKGADNETLASNIAVYNKHNFRVWCDSSEPRTINELIKLGIRAVGVRKGQDSVRHGIKWLQSLNGIYINPITCPHTYKEFTEYEYKTDRYGEYTGELLDKNNHTIDATRYALNTKIEY